MLTTSACPDTDLLQQLLSGNLTGNGHEHLTEHLAQCERCRATISSLPSLPGDPSGSLNATLDTFTPRTAPVSGSGSSGTEPLPDQDLEQETDQGTPLPPGTPLSALKAGDRLDKYLILDVLGRGGMGIVFKARDTILERIVAIKILGPLLIENTKARKRFIREGQTAAAIKSEHVVTVYGVEGHESSPYLVLEYVQGQSLEELLAQSGPLPVDDVVTLGTQIAQGLAAAHQKGLVHRDVKPANVLLEKDTRRVLLTDFGLARAVDDASLSRQGEICGTPHYMAPEQVCGEAVDHRADLFSLGSVLYYLCTGELPYSAPTSMAVLQRVCEARPRPIRECNPSVPFWLANLVAALHARNPEDRPQSAQEVVAALNARGAMAPTLSPEGARSDVHPAIAAPSVAASGRSSRFSSSAFVLILGVFFLASLPAVYFLTAQPKDDHEKERGREQTLAAVPPKPASNPRMEVPERPAERPTSPERHEVHPAVPSPTIPKRSTATPEEKKSVVAPQPIKGIVVVVGGDAGGTAYLRNDVIQMRDQRTGETICLSQGRNELALGTYKVLHPDPGSGVKVSPRQFTLTADASVFLRLTHPTKMEPAPMPHGEGPPPPFPPPPGPGPGRGGMPPPPRR
jgi:serine/threonine protein kinase